MEAAAKTISSTGSAAAGDGAAGVSEEGGGAAGDCDAGAGFDAGGSVGGVSSAGAPQAEMPIAINNTGTIIDRIVFLFITNILLFNSVRFRIISYLTYFVLRDII